MRRKQGRSQPWLSGGRSWWASRWRVSANCALACTGGCLRGDMPPSEAGRFWNFDTKFTQFSDNFYAKFIPLEMFKYSSPFSSPPFLPFSPFFSSLFLSFPFSLFLPLFLFPFLFSFSLFFLPFSLPFPLFSFLSPFFPFPIFALLPDFWCPGGSLPPCPPIGYAPGRKTFFMLTKTTLEIQILVFLNNSLFDPIIIFIQFTVPDATLIWANGNQSWKRCKFPGDKYSKISLQVIKFPENIFPCMVATIANVFSHIFTNHALLGQYAQMSSISLVTVVLILYILLYFKPGLARPPAGPYFIWGVVNIFIEQGNVLSQPK